MRATFERFVAAQNAHDEKALAGLLLPLSADFLWITRGAPVWGHDQAMKRFSGLFQTTWQLAPEPSGLKVTMMGVSPRFPCPSPSPLEAPVSLRRRRRF